MLAPSERLARDDVRSAQPSARAPHPADARFDVVVDRRPDELARRWARTAPQATVFQTESFLWAWYATIGRTVGEPLLLSAIDRRTGDLAAMLPLVRRKNEQPTSQRGESSSHWCLPQARLRVMNEVVR